MKRAIVLMILVSMIVWSAAGYAQDNPGDPPPPRPTERGVSGFGMFFNVGPSFNFLDLEQFDEELDIVSVGHYRPTQRFDFEGSFGLDIHWRTNGLRIAMGGGDWRMIRNNGDRYAEFYDSRFAVDVAYKGRFGAHVNLIAGSWLGVGSYEYDLHSPRLQALEKQTYLFAAPELALETIFTSIGFGVAGQYLIPMGLGEDDYGDFYDAGREEEIDLSRFAVRVYLILGFWEDEE